MTPDQWTAMVQHIRDAADEHLMFADVRDVPVPILTSSAPVLGVTISDRNGLLGHLRYTETEHGHHLIATCPGWKCEQTATDPRHLAIREVLDVFETIAQGAK